MAKAKQSIRVLMADDHVIFRDGLRKSSTTAPRRPRDGTEDDHREEEAQQHRAGRADAGDERGGEGAAELDGDDTAEDE